MFKSIFLKYFMVTAVMVVVCFTLLGTVLLVMTANYSIEEKQNQLLHTAQKLSKLTADMEISPFGLYHTLESDEEAQRSFNNYLNILSLFTESGSRDIIIVSAFEDESLWFTNTDEIRYGEQFIPEEITVQLKTTGVYKSTGTLGGIFGENRYTVGLPMVAEKTTESGNVISFVSGYMFVSSPAESLTAMLQVVSRFFFVSVAVVLAVSIIMVYIGTKSLTRPITEMKTALEKFSRGDFSYRVRVKGNDEIAELCTSFNEMADALEQAESSRRGFMANISHDLKTPMTSITGFIDGILDGTIPYEREKQYLSRVSEEMKRLCRLVNSILDITRLEGGQISINIKEFDINETIRRVLLSFERVIDEKGITVKFPPDEKLMVSADEDSVYRILTNLVGNSTKFTPSGGEISVDTARQQRQYAVVRVRNTGGGIAAEEIPFIFERFYKSDKSRGLDKEGMGLGLYIAKMLVNLNNGEIGVDSVPGQYTEFYFTLELFREHGVARFDNIIKKS